MSTRAGTHWSGDLLVGAGWARFVGNAGSAPSVACACSRVVVAMCSWVVASSTDGADARRFAGAVVASDAPLAIDRLRPYAQVLFLDARLAAAYRLHPRRTASMEALGRDRAALWRRAIYAIRPESSIHDVVQALLPGQRETTPEESLEAESANAAALRDWARVGQVARSCRAGVALSDAARESGIGSARQCQMLFRRLFGLSATELLALSDDGVRHHRR
ncbi:hypothetical protein [Tahibacter sp.]|uniref:hypothetical protein n=1 Tax=Tahibacter sp. TaxID=2056211 RepID=UPI0028C4CFFC|nr:hypothetical protein [Tahibacter sp.]